MKKEPIITVSIVLAFWLLFLWWMTPPPMPIEVRMQGPLVIEHDPYYTVEPDKTDYLRW